MLSAQIEWTVCTVRVYVVMCWIWFVNKRHEYWIKFRYHAIRIGCLLTDNLSRISCVSWHPRPTNCSKNNNPISSKQLLAQIRLSTDVMECDYIFWSARHQCMKQAVAHNTHKIVCDFRIHSISKHQFLLFAERLLRTKTAIP